MRRVQHSTWSTIIGVAYLALMTNFLLLVSCLPIVVLLMITDPAYSWPAILAAVPLCAPGLVGAFAAYRAYGRGDGAVVKVFAAAWKASWRKAMIIGALVAAVLAVVLVDVRMLSGLPIGVALVPLLGVLGVLSISTALVALVALAEAPAARLRDVLFASLVLGVKRWYLSAVSLIALAVQIGVFTAMPAIAIGLTAAPVLYVAWANARFTLRPVIETEEVAA